MKYAHTCIRVKNLEKSIEFYEKALGYKVVETRDFPKDKFTLCYLSLVGDEDVELELTYNYGHGDYNLGDGYGHVALFSDNLEEDYRRLKTEGYNVTDLKGLSTEAPRYFFITDPDGYKTEIIRAK